MDRMLYLAMNGASQILKAQAANTNNLANANTTAFKADLAAFRSQPVYGPGEASRVYAQAEKPGSDLSQGSLNTTGRELDLALKGDGWIAVQTVDGSEAYTRAGDLRVSSNGQLVTGAGHPVLGNGGPIAIPPAQKLEIGSDGTITIQPVGQGPETLAVVDRIRLVNPPQDQITKGHDGLFRSRDGFPVPADAEVRVVSGTLETSNVSAVESLVNMIELSRRFEMQIKVMKAAEENDASSASIMRMGG